MSKVCVEGKKVAWVVASGKLLASWQQPGQDGWWRLIPHTSHVYLLAVNLYFCLEAGSLQNANLALVVDLMSHS